ncbi:MAG: hypothetical protein AVDCRST_MAG77-241 [uncultured Chloroflexi bacterium]|uniref:Uncharacterized protein n=1 Tax=uncultured Chloroflexota bacterium TaxID=166587 RepID=A0A6J4H7S1_9CHLR|nr:MAG: hypothetical protein AVDCRST_MAG77-241 [uncultured Chloroflexota bacterium]
MGTKGGVGGLQGGQHVRHREPGQRGDLARRVAARQQLEH